MPDCIDDMIAALSSEDESTRRFAIEDLGDLGNPRVLKPLAEALADRSAAVREAAVDALSRIGSQETAETVIPLLRSEMSPTRNAACVVLSSIGEPAVEPLRELLCDEDKDVRKFAVDILASIASTSAADALVQALQDSDINVASAAAEALGNIGSASDVSALVAALKAANWMRCSIARSLGQIGGEEALRALTDLIGDEDEMIVFAALQSLATVGNATTIQYLLYYLNHDNPLIVNTTIATLEQIIDRVEDIPRDILKQEISLEPVVALTCHPEASLRQSAVKMLGKIGNESEQVLECLAKVLIAEENQSEQELRECARKAIVSIAPSNIDVLIKHIENETCPSEGRCELIDVLGFLGRPQAFDVVRSQLDSSDVRVRRVASRVIADISPEQAGSVLCEKLNDSDGHVRANAAHGLGKLMSNSAAPNILPLLKDPMPEVRTSAAWTLGVIGPQDNFDAVRALQPLLDDPYTDVREAGAQALASMATDASFGVLIALMDSDQEERRLLGIRGLGQAVFDKRAKDALFKAMCDPAPAVRNEAIWAIGRLGDFEVTDEFLRGLDHADPAIRRATVQLLAGLTPGDWSSRLIDLFKTDDDAHVRHESARALGRLKLEEAVDTLAAYLESDPDEPFVVIGVLEGLGYLGDERVLDLIDRYVESDDPEVAETAANAMCAITDGVPVGSM